MSWHAAPDALARFARTPELLDDVTASSVEQHLLACDACRAVVADAAAPTAIAASWLAVAQVIDQPQPSVLERLLSRLGVREDTARLVAATGGLQLAWLGTVVVLACAAVAVSGDEGSDAFFLVVAPLLPLAATALAFLPATDPSSETGIATALHGVGVAIRRAIATVVPTLAVLALLTPALPEASARSAAWLLPSLALAASSLLLATLVRMPVAVGLAAAGWVAALATLRAAPGIGGPIGESPAFGPGGQLTAVAVLAMAVSGLVLRRDRFATMEVDW
jgi:hypothetical protein